MAHFEKQWDKHPEWSYFIPNTETNPNVKAAMEMDVYTYLTSNRCSIGVELIPKGNKFIVNYYDGLDHDSGSNILTERGFAHFARGITGVKRAIPFLMNYSNFPYKEDYSACLNEVMEACFGESLRRMDDAKYEFEQNRGKKINPVVKSKFSQRFTCSPFITAADIARLTEKELALIKPSAVSDDIWKTAIPEQKIKLLRNSATEAERQNITYAMRFSLDKGNTWIGKKVPEPALEIDFENPTPLTKEIEVVDKLGNTVKKKAPDNKRLYGYLMNSRGFSYDMISWLLNKKYMYSGVQETYIDKNGEERPFTEKKYDKTQKKYVRVPSPHYLVVVCGRESELKVRSLGLNGEELAKRLKACSEVTYAYKREEWEVWDKIHIEHPKYKTEYAKNPDGTLKKDSKGHLIIQDVTEKDENGVEKKVLVKPFKGEATGSKKSNCWRHENPNSHTLYVFEAPFDAFSLMNLQAERIKSHMESYGKYEPLGYYLDNGPNFIALGGVAANGLQDILSYRTDLTKIVICMDRDEPHIDKNTGLLVAGAGQINTQKLINFVNEINKNRVGTELPQIQVMDIADDPNTTLDVSKFIKVDYNNQPSVKNGKIEHCKDINEFLRSYRANQGVLEQMNVAIYQDKSTLEVPKLKYQNMITQDKSVNIQQKVDLERPSKPHIKPNFNIGE